MKEALAILYPDTDTDPVGPLGWLRSAIDELRDRGPGDNYEDPDAYWMMVDELETFHRRSVCAALQPEEKP